MTDDLQPYAPVASESLQPETDGRVATSAIWIAYIVTPPVAPLLLSVLVFVLALAFSDPKDTGTPIGIILVPIFLMTGGLFLSYMLMLIIGMPMIFFLRRRNKLTLSNLLWSGTLTAVIFGTLFVIVQVQSEGGPGQGSFFEIILVMCIASLAFAAVILLQIAAFWAVMKNLDRKRRLAPAA